MRLPKWGRPLSVRARLTLGNVAILGAILLGLGVLLHSCAAVWLAQEMDQEMAGLVRPLTGRFSQRVLAHLRQQPLLDLNPLVGNPDLPGREARFPIRALDPERRRLLTGEPTTPYDETGFARAMRGKTHYSTVVLEGEKARVFSVPLTSAGEVMGVLQLARSFHGMQRQLDRLTSLLILFFPVALLAASGGGLYLTRRALRPVRFVTQAAARIEAHDLSRRLAISGDDEFSELASTFNAMLGRLERAFIQQRRFTADASHELRTPLAAITGDVSLALSTERTADEYRHTLEGVAVSTDRMRRIVQDLLQLAHSEDNNLLANFELIALGPILHRAITAIQKTVPAGPTLTCELPSDREPEIVGDAYPLERLFLNLLENAARHTPATGTVYVKLSHQDGQVVVTVVDTGEGIAPEHLPHIFESFYRADSSRARNSGGTGLGLAICRSIVDAHQGKITVESQPGHGTVVTVIFTEVCLTQDNAA